MNRGEQSMADGTPHLRLVINNNSPTAGAASQIEHGGSFVSRWPSPVKADASDDERRETYGALNYYAYTKGYQPGWAYYAFRDLFGEMPRYRKVPVVEPSEELVCWIEERTRAWHEAQESAPCR
jgi:hypothetical protein